MAYRKRHKTSYKGVTYFEVQSKSRSGKPDKLYYIRYQHPNTKKVIEDKIGLSSAGHTPAKCAQAKARRETGLELPNAERREKAQDQDVWTFEKIMQHYDENHPRKNARNDTHLYNKYLKSSFGKKIPAELVPLDIQRLKRQKLKHLQPASVRNVLTLLRRLSGYAEKQRLCKGLDFKIEMPRVNNEKTEFLTPEEVNSLIQACDKYANISPIATMVKIALFSGMRKMEIMRLKWTDIDFDNSVITIRDPKSGQDERIPLNASTREILETIPYVENFDLVFPNRNGDVRAPSVYRITDMIKKDACLPKSFRPFHGCRHSFASHLASSGKVDLYTLSKLLTHKNPQITKRYAHLTDKALKDASNMIGKLIT